MAAEEATGEAKASKAAWTALSSSAVAYRDRVNENEGNIKKEPLNTDSVSERLSSGSSVLLAVGLTSEAML